jgi:uncharacterized protein (TIGR03086 family)
MSDISARYARLAETMTKRVDGVPDDAWDDPTPCEDWNVRDLVKHLAETHAMFGGFVKLPPADGPDPAKDPRGAWVSARDQMQAWLDDPDVAGAEFEGMSGTSTLEDSVDQFICFDLNVHGWDLAHATGQDDTIDPDELPKLWKDVEGLGEMIRSSGTCGPEVTPPEDASEQERLLAYLGRDPRA